MELENRLKDQLSLMERTVEAADSGLAQRDPVDKQLLLDIKSRAELYCGLLRKALGDPGMATADKIDLADRITTDMELKMWCRWLRSYQKHSGKWLKSLTRPLRCAMMRQYEEATAQDLWARHVMKHLKVD